jgi:chemotaxis methyl-accepting protein methylase
MQRRPEWFLKAKLLVGRGLQAVESWLPRGFRASRVACTPYSYLFRDVGDYWDQISSYHAQVGGELQILSVGCARGEEPVSIGILCHAAGIPFSLTGIDWSAGAIAQAQSGVYDLAEHRARLQDDLADDPHSPAEEGLRLLEQHAAYFQPVVSGGSQAKVIDAVRSRLRFQVLDCANLPFVDEFDFILCRKMLHYLPAAKRRVTADKMKRALKKTLPPNHLIYDGYTRKQPFFQEL